MELNNSSNIINNNNCIKEENDSNKQIYLDSDMNYFSYKEALDKDKRTFLQYYFSLIKAKHLIIFSFFLVKDYNSRVIKICLFFYSFALFYFVNSLFFTEAKMHKIYEDGGLFNFIYSIPQILYSSIISSIINSLIRFLSLTENIIIKIKKMERKEAIKELPKIKKCIKIKLIIFFILCFILLILFWYYLASFGAIYQNTQKHLLKDTLASFGFSMIYPFIIYLIPSLLRVLILRYPEYHYKFSQLIQSL